MKRCYRCREYKALAEFYADKSQKDGRCNRCKQCEKADNTKNPHRRAIKTWSNLCRRVRTNKAYVEVQVRLTKEEFLEWAVPEFTRFIEKYPSQTPCVDRIEASGHYEPGNIRLICTKRNMKRTRKFTDEGDLAVFVKEVCAAQGLSLLDVMAVLQ